MMYILSSGIPEVLMSCTANCDKIFMPISLLNSSLWSWGLSLLLRTWLWWCIFFCLLKSHLSMAAYTSKNNFSMNKPSIGREISCKYLQSFFCSMGCTLLNTDLVFRTIIWSYSVSCVASGAWEFCSDSCSVYLLSSFLLKCFPMCLLELASWTCML